jgi:RNA-directed DNA polymerase
MASLKLARRLAQAVLAGSWSSTDIAGRIATVLNCRRPRKWITVISERIIRNYGLDAPLPLERSLARFLAGDRDVEKWEADELSGESSEHPPFLSLLDLPRPTMTPAARLQTTAPIRVLTTPGELASWLCVTPSHLDWLADCHGREGLRPNGPLRHYHYLAVAKRSGKKRLLEIPKSRLKAIQQSILHEILDHIPPHPAAHAFRTGHSTVTCAASHTGQRVVLRIDLREFFPSIQSRRVMALFRTIGYPERVARLLTGLCTNTVPDDVLQELDPGASRTSPQAVPHLPQGAPTSPALANLCAFRLDCRLAGLARKMGIHYSRYADDLIFSGDRDFEKSLAKFRILVCAIVLDEGFQIRRRKTRVMRSGTRQEVAGIVVNQRVNLAREEFDRIKAILFNCARHGAQSQNRDGVANFREHLRGRVSYVQMVNPARGAKLCTLFDQIQWDD